MLFKPVAATFFCPLKYTNTHNYDEVILKVVRVNVLTEY